MFSRSVILILCNPMDCSIPGFPVFHYLPEFAQTHVHWVDDAIQPSHPLSSPSPPGFNLFPVSGSFPVSQFFASCGQSIGASVSASVLPMNIQGWFFLAVQGTLKSLLQHHSFCWLYRASLSLASKNIINLTSVLTIWWCPCVESSLCCWKRVFSVISAFSWQKSISLCPASFCTPRSNLPVTPGISWFLLLHSMHVDQSHSDAQ